MEGARLGLHGSRGHVTTDGTFFCDGCGKRRLRGFRHGSGFCVDCIERGKRFWLNVLSVREVQVLARAIWGTGDEEQLAA